MVTTSSSTSHLQVTTESRRITSPNRITLVEDIQWVLFLGAIAVLVLPAGMGVWLLLS